MLQRLDAGGFTESFDRGLADAAIAQGGELDTLLALEQVAARRSFTRDEEIYAEGVGPDCWYQVVSGTVRICKLLADGRRQIAAFCFGGDCFGLDDTRERAYAAEAVDHVIVMRYPRRATEQLADGNPSLARRLRAAMLGALAGAQTHILLLGRMNAPERVASFLLEMGERRDTGRSLDLPMPRADIADYLGLTIETVCRVLSALKRDGTIAIPSSNRIELCDRGALAAIGEA